MGQHRRKMTAKEAPRVHCARDHSQHTDHNQEVQVQDREAPMEEGVRTHWLGVIQALDVRVGSPALKDRNQSDTVDMQHGEHVCAGIQVQVYKNRDYSRDTLSSSPWDARTSTRHRQSNSHTWRTTSTQAFVASYIRARTRTHRLFCIDLLANVCTPLPDARAREDVLAEA